MAGHLAARPRRDVRCTRPASPGQRPAPPPPATRAGSPRARLLHVTGIRSLGPPQGLPVALPSALPTATDHTNETLLHADNACISLYECAWYAAAQPGHECAAAVAHRLVLRLVIGKAVEEGVRVARRQPQRLAPLSQQPPGRCSGDAPHQLVCCTLGHVARTCIQVHTCMALQAQKRMINSLAMP